MAHAFRDRVALVTGASSGIGAALAEALAAQGAHVALLARRHERLQTLAAKIERGGRRALAVPCDVTRQGELEHGVARVRETFGVIDIVIANAGTRVTGECQDLTLEDYRRQFETNVFGVLNTIYATLADLRQSRGRLVVMGSVMSHVALRGNAPYAMSKHALRALCESLVQGLKHSGVSVTHICPGYVGTELRQVDKEGNWRAELPDPVPPWLLTPADKAARDMLRAIASRRREHVLTTHAKIAILLQRHCPGLLRALFAIAKVRPGQRSPG